MKNTTNNLIINQADYLKIASLLHNAQSESLALLEEELAHATVVPDEELPHDVAAMKSKVSFKDLDSGKESVVILVYPDEANIAESKISVLTPVGSALLGLRVGQDIQWPLPNGKKKKLLVTSVAQTAPSAA